MVWDVTICSWPFLIYGKKKGKGQMIPAYTIQNNTSSEERIQSSFLSNNKAHLSQMNSWEGREEMGISHIQLK